MTVESREHKPGFDRPGPVGRLVEPAGLEASTGYLLARVGRESRRRWARTLTDLDLTPHQYSALMALDQLGAMSQQTLSRRVGIDPRNAGPVIDSLDAAGLIDRTPDPTNRRRYAVTLTGTGHTVVTELQHTAQDTERQLLAPLTAAEHRNLHELLSKLFTVITGPSQLDRQLVGGGEVGPR